MNGTELESPCWSGVTYTRDRRDIDTDVLCGSHWTQISRIWLLEFSSQERFQRGTRLRKRRTKSCSVSICCSCSLTPFSSYSYDKISLTYSIVSFVTFKTVAIHLQFDTWRDHPISPTLHNSETLIRSRMSNCIPKRWTFYWRFDFILIPTKLSSGSWYCFIERSGETCIVWSSRVTERWIFKCWYHEINNRHSNPLQRTLRDKTMKCYSISSTLFHLEFPYLWRHRRSPSSSLWLWRFLIYTDHKKQNYRIDFVLKWPVEIRATWKYLSFFGDIKCCRASLMRLLTSSPIENSAAHVSDAIKE